MKAISMSPRSGQRMASSNAVVFLHGHQLERNLARAVTAEAAGTFVLVLAITSAAVAAALSRPIAGAPDGSLAVPVAGGLALAIAVASVGHISGAHRPPDDQRITIPDRDWRLAACGMLTLNCSSRSPRRVPSLDRVTQAKAICAGRPIRRHCPAFALDTRQDHGVWGGTTEQERRPTGNETLTRT